MTQRLYDAQGNYVQNASPGVTFSGAVLAVAGGLFLGMAGGGLVAYLIHLFPSDYYLGMGIGGFAGLWGGVISLIWDE